MGDAKKKLFIPRNISGEDNRWAQWNKEQPIVDGERINQYNVNTGRKDGLWIMYDNNGRILYKIGYKDGEYEGIHQTFYLNGKIQFDGQTKNNEFTGLWKMYYMNGSLGEIGSFDDGKKYGIWKWYYSFNNQLEKIVNYIDGKPDGLSIEYFEYGDIRRKDIYKMAKKIAYIVYDKDGSVRESMDWKDDYDNMIIKEQMENKDEILKSWINYYGSDNTANWELELYESEVEDLIENGGNIYRVLFIDNLSEVNLKDMGNHWTTSRNNVIDVAEINQQYYGKNKQKVIVIEGYVEPNSITIEGVDIKGNPHEKEVNIINGKDVKIKQIFEYVGKKLIPIDMNINEQIENKDEILKSFEPQKELNPKVWDEDDKLKKKIKDTLVAIGQEFHKTLEVEAPIEDIIFTGSLANYNWSQYSDVDLHVLIDFNKFDDKELIKKYFDAKKAVWNDNHDIKIKGYDVELYAQDKDEPHESTGIYSVMNDEWIKKPKPQDVKIDRETIKKKVKQFESEYNRIVELYKDGKYEETRKALDKIKDKIKKYRKAGLDKGGEMATENLVFKTMRRSGLMDKIYELGLETTDKEYTIETLDEAEKKKLFIPRKLSGEDSRWADWNKDQPIVDGVRINQYDINTGKKEGIWEEYFDNGKLYYKGSFNNGKKDGYWEYYRDNGQLWSKGSYNNDERDGIWEKYRKNGQLWYKGSYKNGKKEGYWEWYHDNGQLMSSGSYKNDKRDGLWEWYHDNGQLYSSSSYKNGELIKKLDESEKKKLFIPRKLSGEDSRWAQWNKEQPIVDGERINQYNINTGKKEGYWEEYHDEHNGEEEYSSKGSYNNGVVEGYWGYYYSNGQLMSSGSYNNGLRDGIWEKYLSNGQLIYKGSYNNGDRDGIWEEYYSNGQLYSKLSFKNGVADGIWEKYRSNGQLIYKGSYKNGERDGYWEWYHDNGQLMSKGSYKNDKRDGYWEDYWWNGQLNSSGLYKNGELIENINEAETPKKKLFTPKRIDERKKEWNEMQPTIDGKKINQYDLTTGDMTGRWGEGDMDGGDTTNLLNVYWDVFSDDYWLRDGKLSEKENVFNNLKDRILSNLSWDIGEDAPLGHMHFDLTIPLRSKKVRDKFEELYGESEYTGLWKSNYINEGKISDNIDDILKKFKKNIGLDVGFLTSFGSGINALIRNISSLIKEYSIQPLNAFEITNLAIAMIVVYLRQNKSLKGFKDEMLSIVAFTSLMPAYSDIVNSLLGNVDFMDAFMTLIKSAGVYAMLTHFKNK